MGKKKGDAQREQVKKDAAEDLELADKEAQKVKGGTELAKWSKQNITD